MTKVLKVFFHDACFDGTASAALFARFYRDVVSPAELALAPMQHSEGDPFAGVPIDGDDNACLDFRFCADPKMRWWFDHHKTAFQPPSLRDTFERGRPEARWVFDPNAPSCAGLIARTLHERWSWKPPAHLAEVVQWADRIDAARFANAIEATSLVSPAQQLALWLGAAASPAEIAQYVHGLADGVDLEAAAHGFARDGIDRALASRSRQRELIERVARRSGDVIALDLSAEPDAITPGFVGYELYPDCRYTVSLTRTPTAVKIAVGANPWGPPRTHDIGLLCERHGGGGHAAVGGITFGPQEIDRGRRVFAEIVDELSR